jgi:hypothetical protein
MLSCKDVAQLASTQIDNNGTHVQDWKIRWHLLFCVNCRRFMKHLKITRQIAPQFAEQKINHDTAEAILDRIKKTEG